MQKFICYEKPFSLCTEGLSFLKERYTGKRESKMGSQVLIYKGGNVGFRVFGMQDGKQCADKNLIIGTVFDEVSDQALRNKIRLKTADLSPNVKKIGKRSFFGCTSLHKVNFGNLEVVQEEAFCGCSKLKEIYFPASTKAIKDGAFKECKRLETVTFEPSRVNFIIPRESFYQCQKLTKLILPSKLNRIEDRAFYKCQSLSKLHFPVTLESIGREAFYQTGFTMLKLPRNLKVLDDSAFFKCNQLEYVILPESLKKIGKWVFHGCNRLKILEIHHDPDEIGDWIINKSAMIRCKKGSMLDEYCEKFGFTREYL